MILFRQPQQSVSALLLTAIFFCLGLAMVADAQAQAVVFDIVSTRVEAGRLTRVPIQAIVPALAKPVKVRLVVTFDGGILTPSSVVDGPAVVAAKKKSTSRSINSSNLEITVQGTGEETIASGTFVYVDFRVDPMYLSRIVNVRITDTSVTDSLGTVLPASSKGGMVVINNGFYHPKELYFAQMASGLQSVDFGGYDTALILTNLAPGGNGMLVEFIDDQGQPLNLTLGGDYDNTFYMELTGNSTVVLEPTNPGPIKKGWVRIRSTEAVGGNVLYSYVNTFGVINSQTGILPSFFTTSFAFTVDTRTDKVVGLAVANPTENGILMELELRDQGGTILSRKSMSLVGLGHFALVMEEIFPEVNLKNFVGRVVVRSNDRLTDPVATTLRFSRDLLIFTSQPVIVM